MPLDTNGRNFCYDTLDYRLIGAAIAQEDIERSAVHGRLDLSARTCSVVNLYHSDVQSIPAFCVY
jgi:hypothetical protein